MTPEMIQAELRKEGFTTDSLFKGITQSVTQSVDPQMLANEEAIARAKVQGEAQATEQGVKDNTAPEVAPIKTKANIAPTFFDEEPKEHTVPTEDESSLQSVEPEDDGEAELSDESIENFRKLRTNHREIKRSLKEKDTQIKELMDKLNTYVPPETVQEKEATIQKLAHYEKIHNLKTSKEYNQMYVEPLNQEHAKLKSMLKDYGVPEEALDDATKHALSLNNTAELNGFLADHFGDPIGAQEAKTVITNIKNIESRAREAESEPTRTLESLQEESRRLAESQEQIRRTRVTQVAKSAWEETIGQIMQEGQIKELIPVEDDPEFNENYPHKLLGQAATEYGKLITEMAKEGVTPSKEVAKALAKMVALSQVAGVSILTRNRAMDHAEEIMRNADRTSGLFRPGSVAGGSASRVTAETSQRVAPPEDELKKDVSGLLSQVLSKR